MQSSKPSVPPPAAHVVIDEAADLVRIEIPIDLFRAMGVQQLAGIENTSGFLTSTHAAEIRRLVNMGKQSSVAPPGAGVGQ